MCLSRRVLLCMCVCASVRVCGFKLVDLPEPRRRALCARRRGPDRIVNHGVLNDRVVMHPSHDTKTNTIGNTQTRPVKPELRSQGNLNCAPKATESVLPGNLNCAPRAT